MLENWNPVIFAENRILIWLGTVFLSRQVKHPSQNY